MQFHAARHALTVAGSSRVGRCASLVALVLAFGCESLQTAIADGDTRTISFHHIHTGEDLTVTYKRNGRFDEDSLKKINHLMRDWRRNEEIRMDPKTIDIIWEVNREVGGTAPIQVICGYRAPSTNAMLRRRSRAVAQFSQHTLGKAVDYYIPGVPLEVQREAGLRLQRGGVGYYPGNNGQFVHMDTGSVRYWPHMPEAQYARIMSKRPTMVAARNPSTTEKPARNLLASLFSGGSDGDEDTAEATASTRIPAPRTEVAAAAPQPAARPVPMPRPATRQVAKAETPAPKPASFTVASIGESRPVKLAPAAPSAPSPADIVASRGYWQGPQVDPEAEAARRPAVKLASVSVKSLVKPRVERQTTTATTTTAMTTPWPLKRNPADAADQQPSNIALAFAALNDGPAAPRTAPMGSTAARNTYATTIETLGATTVARRSTGRPALQTAAMTDDVPPLTSVTTASDDDPWLRALLLAPNLQNYMTTSLLGDTDPRQLQPLMTKPATAVMMTFSDDPHLGMTSERFTGTAVVFVSTVTFNQRTAMLQ